ncbi:GntR family transcriptional regulator [Clostridium sp. MB40-C1]|uniref:GntR family transcriptional regulator n=1 Tax=Clostridium sp. MB40-C1 TaxID=3070996 RepID=UPI0027E019B9|nr:GntR family transcriptional regulator [Clostridium sp. MB40-C1]WMJ81100.1 GntR family transcriptional regulator [Clostridium sp. MB40-C1]
MKIIISNSSGEPIYEQIKNSIKSQIIDGTLEESEALPSIRSLAKELQISVITTKRAYSELEAEGFIETVAGKGSFVASQNKEFLMEQKLKIIEDKLLEVVNESKMINLSFSEVVEMLKILFEETN